VTVDLVKFDGTGNFRLWQRRVKDLLVARFGKGFVREDRETRENDRR
jgi:hypothetical protein